MQNVLSTLFAKVAQRHRKDRGKSAKHRTGASAVKNFGELSFEIVQKPNNNSNRSNRGGRITFVRNPIIRKSDKVMTIGSCFALEIKHALLKRGFDVYPKYGDIKFDPNTQRIGKLPHLDDVNHYDTFTIRAEFERAFAGDHYSDQDFIKHTSRLGLVSAGLLGSEIWQEPYRRHVFGTSKQAVRELSRELDACIRDAIFKADVYVITPGVTEIWRNVSNGYIVNKVTDPRARNTAFERSTYQQNYENLACICSLIGRHFPEKKIILTVSPVPLNRTFSDDDIVIANSESKSILRAAAATIRHEFANVIYWPSYEIVRARDVYREDGRHIIDAAVEAIIDQFLAVHLED